MAAASPDMRVPVGSLITWELTPAFSASVRKVMRERLAAATGRSKRLPDRVRMWWPGVFDGG
jgi:hypothetical protein